MKGISFLLALAAIICFTTHAFAREYAALEGYDLYVGAVAVVFNGDDSAGNGDSDFLGGISLNGLVDQFHWQAFWALGWGEDAMLTGGSVDYILTSNFDDCGSGQESYSEGLWWLGAGPTVVSYREMLGDSSGTAIDGEELGLNLGGGYLWSGTALDAKLHIFPDSGNTMLSVAFSRAF